MTQDKTKATISWFEKTVLGLNLCPFAHAPYKERAINFAQCSLDSVESSLIHEAESIKARKYQTSLLIIESDISFISFLDLLEELGLIHNSQDFFQFIAFHPNFVFSGLDFFHPANYVNRSPYPTIHIIKNDELTGLMSKEEAVNLSKQNEKKFRTLTQWNL